MKKRSIWVFEWRKSVHYWWSYISFSPECKELTSMLDPLWYRWGVPPVVIRCVHWTMQRGVLQTWIKALALANVMFYPTRRMQIQPLNSLKTVSKVGDLSSMIAMTAHCFGALSQVHAIGHCVIGQERDLFWPDWLNWSVCPWVPLFEIQIFLTP